jgi:lipoprotein-releasing system permease protein
MLGVATLIIVMAAVNGFRKELYFLSKLPADVDVVDTMAVLIMALTLSLLATLYPSWRAGRLDPVEALR